MKKKSKSDKKIKVTDLGAEKANPKGGTYHTGGVNVLMADGSVRTTTNTTELKANKN